MTIPYELIPQYYFLDILKGILIISFFIDDHLKGLEYQLAPNFNKFLLKLQPFFWASGGENYQYDEFQTQEQRRKNRTEVARTEVAVG